MSFLKPHKFARVQWTVEDVWYEFEGTGETVTETEAQEILESCEDKLADAMVEAGWAVLGAAIQEWRQNRGGLRNDDEEE